MEHKELMLTPSEWQLMECLWDHAPQSGRDAVEYLKSHVGWSRSTTLTMLRRMSEKGLVSCTEANGLKVYAPLIPRDDAVQRETDSFLSRVYQGSVSTLMSAITQRQKLSQEEIQELYEIIRQAEQK